MNEICFVNINSVIFLFFSDFFKNFLPSSYVHID